MEGLVSVGLKAGSRAGVSTALAGRAAAGVGAQARGHGCGWGRARCKRVAEGAQASAWLELSMDLGVLRVTLGFGAPPQPAPM